MVVVEEEREVDVVATSRRLVIAVAPASGWLRPSPRHKETSNATYTYHRVVASAATRNNNYSCESPVTTHTLDA